MIRGYEILHGKPALLSFPWTTGCPAPLSKADARLLCGVYWELNYLSLLIGTQSPSISDKCDFHSKQELRHVLNGELAKFRMPPWTPRIFENCLKKHYNQGSVQGLLLIISW